MQIGVLKVTSTYYSATKFLFDWKFFSSLHVGTVYRFCVKYASKIVIQYKRTLRKVAPNQSSTILACLKPCTAHHNKSKCSCQALLVINSDWCTHSAPHLCRIKLNAMYRCTATLKTPPYQRSIMWIPILNPQCQQIQPLNKLEVLTWFALLWMQTVGIHW